MVRSVAPATAALHTSPATIIDFQIARIASSPLAACCYYEVLRFFRSWIVNAVQFVGMDECCGSWPDDRCLALNGHRDGPLHQQEEFLMHVPVRWMGLASRGKDGLVNFQVLAGMEQAVENRPGLVFSVFLNRQIVIRLNKGPDYSAIRCQGRGCREHGNCLQKRTPGCIHKFPLCDPQQRLL